MDIWNEPVTDKKGAAYLGIGFTIKPIFEDYIGSLKAFDADTGEELWKFQTGSGIVGQPITWDMDGEQYVAVASGWGGAVPLWGGEVAKKVNYLNQGGSIWVFKLPKQLASAN